MELYVARQPIFDVRDRSVLLVPSERNVVDADDNPLLDLVDIVKVDVRQTTPAEPKAIARGFAGLELDASAVADCYAEAIDFGEAMGARPAAATAR